MKTRKATPRDRADLARLRVILSECITGHEAPPGYRQEPGRHFQERDGEEPLYPVAEEDGKILGSVAASFLRIFPGARIDGAVARGAAGL